MNRAAAAIAIGGLAAVAGILAFAAGTSAPLIPIEAPLAHATPATPPEIPPESEGRPPRPVELCAAVALARNLLSPASIVSARVTEARQERETSLDSNTTLHAIAIARATGEPVAVDEIANRTIRRWETCLLVALGHGGVEQHEVTTLSVTTRRVSIDRYDALRAIALNGTGAPLRPQDIYSVQTSRTVEIVQWHALDAIAQADTPVPAGAPRRSPVPPATSPNLPRELEDDARPASRDAADPPTRMLLDLALRV